MWFQLGFYAQIYGTSSVAKTLETMKITDLSRISLNCHHQLAIAHSKEIVLVNPVVD